MKVSLKAMRIDKNLTQTALADAVNVTKKTVGAWENGKSMPTIDKIEKICAVLGCGYDDIRWKV